MDWDSILTACRSGGPLIFPGAGHLIEDNLKDDISWYELEPIRPLPNLHTGLTWVPARKVYTHKKVFRRVIEGFSLNLRDPSRRGSDPDMFPSLVQLRQWIQENTKDEALLADIDEARPMLERIDPQCIGGP